MEEDRSRRDIVGSLTHRPVDDGGGDRLVVHEMRSGVYPLPRIYDGRVGNDGHEPQWKSWKGVPFGCVQCIL